jgi:hypothetical protein
MHKQPDYYVPYNEKRDTNILYKISYFEDMAAIGPAAAIISNINDLSKWLIAQINGGKYEGKQVIPQKTIKDTQTPAIALDNTSSIEKGYLELLCPTYGMGRSIASYKGHLITSHGGDLSGIHSQISLMPTDSIGIIIFTIGDHTESLCKIISYNIYERLLGLDETPWSKRLLPDIQKGKQAGKEARSKAETDKVANTKPSHPISDYIGQFEHPAYGTLNITLKEDQLQFDFHKIVLSLNHYHYDRFDTPDDEIIGKNSLNFLTNPQGDIDKVVISLDEGEVTFIRKPDASLFDPIILIKYSGKYESSGQIMEVFLKDDKLFLLIPGQPNYELIPYKTDKFRFMQFADFTVTFIKENGNITAFDLTNPSGVNRFVRK